MTTSLLAGMSNAVLLEDETSQLHILTPATAFPVRPQVEGVMFPQTVLLNNGDEEWLGNLSGARHYLYPVHMTKAFVFTTTFSSALFMLVMQVTAWLTAAIPMDSPYCSCKL